MYVYICMYVCIYVCVSVFMCECMHVYMNVCTCECMYVRTVCMLSRYVSDSDEPDQSLLLKNLYEAVRSAWVPGDRLVEMGTSG